MNRLLLLIIVLNICILSSFAQSNITLEGSVLDQNHDPLTGASVYLQNISKGVITDSQGNYFIKNLNKGKYIIEISFLGYCPVIDTIELFKDSIYIAHLSISTIRLNEVSIAENYTKSRKNNETQNIEIVNEQYLKRNLGNSLMNSIEKLPGITTINIGSGQSKPVIRGLSFNRIVVVEKNIKHESQQWSADHGLEIDQYSIDNVEIIKGPSSLIYGSDAIGGVINLKNNDIPEENTFGGDIDLSRKTNNDFIGTSIFLYGRKGPYFANARITLLDYGDYKVPTSAIDIYSYKAYLYKNLLRNTAGNEQNISFSFGMIFPKFQSSVYISDLNSKSGFFANTHGLEPRDVDTVLHDKSSRDINYPYQTVNHLKIINKNQYTENHLKIETNIGFQRNFRQEWSQYVSHGYMPDEFPDSLEFNPDLERQFDKYIYSTNIMSLYYISDKNLLTTGITGEFQDNHIDGRGFIIPAFKQLQIGGYLINKYRFSEKSILQTGIRYDYGYIETQEYYDWFKSPVIIGNDTTYEYLQRAANLSRHFSNFSWSLGYNYNNQNWMFKVNIGKSFRMPNAKELAANGVNYHNFSYEVGNPNLSPEVSYQVDLGIEYYSNNFTIGATPFINYFSNYIYLNPTPEHDRLYGNGNQIFDYTQSKVFRFGGEIYSTYQLWSFLQVGINGEYVYSEQLSGEKKGFTLPFSPPASIIINVQYQKQQLQFIENPYFSVDLRITAAQNNIVPPEETTEGYQVIDIAFGGNLKVNGQILDIYFQVQNLLNTKYFNHTSYYRLINVPEPGRNLILNISIPFSGKIKQNH